MLSSVTAPGLPLAKTQTSIWYAARRGALQNVLDFRFTSQDPQRDPRMAVHLRLARHGRTHRPYYRVVAIDQREHREGKACEVVGTYDPLLLEQPLQIDLERVHAWVRQGAIYSDGLAGLMRHAKLELYPADVREARERQAAKRKAKRQARAKKPGNVWQPPSRRARLAHAKRVKTARLAELAAAAPKPEPVSEEAPAAEAPAQEG